MSDSFTAIHLWKEGGKVVYAGETGREWLGGGSRTGVRLRQLEGTSQERPEAEGAAQARGQEFAQ